MEAAEAWAIKEGYRLLNLEVFAENKKAQGFMSIWALNPKALLWSNLWIRERLSFSQLADIGNQGKLKIEKCIIGICIH